MLAVTGVAVKIDVGTFRYLTSKDQHNTPIFQTPSIPRQHTTLFFSTPLSQFRTPTRLEIQSYTFLEGVIFILAPVGDSGGDRPGAMCIIQGILGHHPHINPANKPQPILECNTES